MSESDSDCKDTKDFLVTPLNFCEVSEETAAKGLLSEKSKFKYQAIYNEFMEWRQTKKANTFSENVLLAYFTELASKLKPSTLWSRYSMLKATLNINDNVDISTYSKLSAFLKKESTGFTSKKSKVFTSDQVSKFLNDAPDQKYLVTKVALIFGITGTLGKGELCSLTTKDVKDYGSHLLVTVPNTDTHIQQRTFVIEGELYYSIYKKYEALRPQGVYSDRFFLNYQNGKCTKQAIGINKFGNMPKQIAQFLKLPDVEFYTGHSFRRTSAKLLANKSILKRQSGWKPDQVTENYVIDSVNNKNITVSVAVNPSSSTIIKSEDEPQASKRLKLENEINCGESTSDQCVNVFNFTNCSNITIQIVTNKGD